MRIAPLILALGMVAPSKAKARIRLPVDPPRSPPPSKQPRRHFGRPAVITLSPQRSPDGRHVVAVERGAVFIDGRRIHPSLGEVQVLGAPTWRGDSSAVAWTERGDGETRLVVVPDVDRVPEPMAWALPRTLGRDRLHWVAANRVVIGPEALQPRAVASWD